MVKHHDFTTIHHLNRLLLSLTWLIQATLENIWQTLKNMFQTTNQLMLNHLYKQVVHSRGGVKSYDETSLKC